MFRPEQIKSLNDYFLPLSERPKKSIYFCRIDGYSDEIDLFISKYFDAARKNGVVIDGRIPNPDPNNLSYYMEIMGPEFKLDISFLNNKLQKWLPRMNGLQRESVVTAMYATLQDMLRQGKNENMLKNAYTKYMCWLYYKFERIINVLGEENPPKILYCSEISNYELQLLIILSRAGADLVLAEPAGDGGYLKLDPHSEYSHLYPIKEKRAFPPDFSVKWIQSRIVKELNRNRLYGALPVVQNCTNAWMKEASLEEVCTDIQSRNSQPGMFCNAFIAEYGVPDKLLFSGDLFALYRRLKSCGRRICIVNNSIPSPSPKEIQEIHRANYRSAEQMIMGLIPNIQYAANIELQRLMVKSFVDLMLEESSKISMNLARLTSKAVYLLAWLKRYQRELFSNWKMPEISLFALFGGCNSENEALFLRMLSRLPVDVLLIMPDLNCSSCLTDSLLLELHHEQSLPMHEFPVEQAQMRVSTAAYQAERELDTIMYQDSGLYRNQQYSKAEPVTLQTMYEEIAILWDQELKYRPSFAVLNDTVTVPVLLEKISGVKDHQLDLYWSDIKKLMTPDTTMIRKIPWISSLSPNPVKPYATQFLQNRRLQKAKIRQHKTYQYGIFPPGMQEYLLNCLQKLLDQKIIAGTYQNGTEYTIVSTVLNMPKEILRQIQNFDFTKKNPKLIIINTTEKTLGLEDSILIAFLNIVGFDIVFFVPTGYQCIEQYFPNHYIHEHQIGEYMYDLVPPDFDHLQESSLSTLKKLFGRST